MAKDKVLTKRFECTEDGHNKFWAIEEVGPGKFSASWGKVGRPAQGTKLYSQEEINALIPAKMKKGYRQVA